MTSDGQPYHRARYKRIIEEQVFIGYLSKGGVTYQDTDMMTPYERRIAKEFLEELLRGQNESQQQLMNNAALAQQNRSPKSGLAH